MQIQDRKAQNLSENKESIVLSKQKTVVCPTFNDLRS